MLDLWRGGFGDAYTDRQPPADTRPVLRTLLRPYLPELHAVLEVGCNRGDNLSAWKPEAIRVAGIEPNRRARIQAIRNGWPVMDASADELPYRAGSFDLVYTCGVLIHIPPDHGDFYMALSEIHRVSRDLILAVEYEAAEPTAAEYRGIPTGIWKRDYGAEYTSRFHLDLIGYGDSESLAGTPFDGCSWWLLRKPGR